MAALTPALQSGVLAHTELNRWVAGLSTNNNFVLESITFDFAQVVLETVAREAVTIRVCGNGAWNFDSHQHLS